MLKKWLSCVCRRIVGATSHSFEFAYDQIEVLGDVFSPILPVALFFPDKGWMNFEFLLDTGATATILPSSMATELGIDLAGLKKMSMAGVEGSGIDSWLGELKVRIGDRDLTVDCFFVDNPQAPFLLGRAGVLNDYFSLLIDSRKKKLLLKENYCF
ncbi:MAG: retropepsin-like aspartic protease [Patescibacteria group bacterium]